MRLGRAMENQKTGPIVHRHSPPACLAMGSSAVSQQTAFGESYQSQDHNRFYRPIPSPIVDTLPRLKTEGQVRSHVGFSARYASLRGPTSQSLTSRMITRSRASIASPLRYASRSPSASNSGTRWMRDQTFSLCNSLDGKGQIVRVHI